MKGRAGFARILLSFRSFGLFLLMALLTFLPEQTNSKKQPSKRKRKQTKPPSSWDQIKSLLSCKQIQESRVHDPSKSLASSYSKLGSSCSSICSFKDVAHGNTVHKSNNSSPDSSTVGQETGPLRRKAAAAASGSSTRLSSGPTRSSSGVTQLRKLSGCYECHMILDPSRLPISRTICACSQCGEVFPKIESLEHHQAVRHAVSELDPEDSGRNIVEIIFKSSWLKKDRPMCKIERILKVHNTQRTIQRFEDCRETVKTRALLSNKKNPRCAADGNELLRFHCTNLSCALGARCSSSLCGNVPGCGVCTIIRHGFKGKKQPRGGDRGGNGGGGNCTGFPAVGAGGGDHQSKGVRTTASSSRAHDSLNCCEERRAMLVCRVIAGRVKRVEEEAPPEEDAAFLASSYDSVAGYAGIYSNLEELTVFNPRGILPCFVVIYKVLSS